MRKLKGIEGLPLKYILIILVAALVITAVVTIINTITAQAIASTNQTLTIMNDTTTQALELLKNTT
ncbi:MAG: hypothetical protein ACE5J7_03830 [Candidatus Aenigmatarchaeota archaeon]